MAQKYIKTTYPDGSTVISNLRRKKGIPVLSPNGTYTATRVTTWWDGSAMNAAKADGLIYLQEKTTGDYYKVDLPNRGQSFLEKDTMAQMRALTPVEILLLQDGYYKGVVLNGQHVKNDMPNSIEYYISTTAEGDNGGSVIAINNIKLEHDFSGIDLDVIAFGARYNEDFDNTPIVQKLIDKGLNPVISSILTIKGTLTLRKNTTINGKYVSNPKWTDGKSTILHQPTVPGTDLFVNELPQTGYGYLAGIEISNLTIRGNENSGNCFNLKNVANSKFSKIYTDKFTNALKADYLMNVSFELCNFSENSNSAVWFTGGISTTTVFDKCYLHFSKWAGVFEHETCLGVNMINTIWESCTDGGLDIHTDNVMDFTDCYCENVPRVSTANIPMVQIGVNGVEKSPGYPTAVVTFLGGTLAGCNFGIHANSVAIKVGKVSSVKFLGTAFNRANRLIDTTVDTRLVSFRDNSFFEIANLKTGIVDDTKVAFSNYNFVNSPVLTTDGKAFNFLGVSKWRILDEFSQTNSDLVFKKNGINTWLLNNKNSSTWGVLTGNPGNATNVHRIEKTNGDFTGATYTNSAYYYAKADTNGLVHFCTRDSAGNEYMNGVLAVTTANRPLYNYIGRQIYDTTINKPLWWNGSSWADITPNATTTVKGLVNQMANISNLDPGADLSTVVAKINAILTEMKAKGIMAS